MNGFVLWYILILFFFSFPFILTFDDFVVATVFLKFILKNYIVAFLLWKIRLREHAWFFKWI